MKKMIMVLVCVMLTANMFAIGGKKGNKQQEGQEQESVPEASGFKQMVNLMERLKAMKPGDYWVQPVDYGSGNGKTNILTVQLFYQMYTRVGGGFIVQTYTLGIQNKDYTITNLSSLFVSDKEMFGE